MNRAALQTCSAFRVPAGDRAHDGVSRSQATVTAALFGSPPFAASVTSPSTGSARSAFFSLFSLLPGFLSSMSSGSGSSSQRKPPTMLRDAWAGRTQQRRPTVFQSFLPTGTPIPTPAPTVPAPSLTSPPAVIPDDPTTTAHAPDWSEPDSAQPEGDFATGGDGDTAASNRTAENGERAVSKV